jgi:hypothetical protein
MEDRRSNLCARVVEGDKIENGRNSIFKEIVVDNFSELMKDMNLQITEFKRQKENPKSNQRDFLPMMG